MKRFFKRVFLIVFLVVAVLWLISWIKCEVYTMIYHEEFENISSDDIQFGDELKILYYSDEYAEVYYTGNRVDLVTFRKKKGEWFVNSHRVVKYAEDKNSSMFVWPYFWDYVI